MKAKVGVNFHNRFDIVKNSEWVGFAENIVLDQMYTRLCNFQTYFVNIHFGTGSGIPSPERTSLFSHLNTKAAINEELIKAIPTSKWTRKIILAPEEFVDQTITEVGIAFGATATNLVTHAMIKDAEGNPLSITKTALDVVEIYATVFITVNETEFIRFRDAPSNTLIGYLTGGTAPSSKIQVSSGFSSLGVIDMEISSLTGTLVIDTVNKKRKISGRFPIGDANTSNMLKSVLWENIFKSAITSDGSLKEETLTNVNVGVGDGITTVFNIPCVNPTNLVVRVDGVVTTDYTIQNGLLPSPAVYPIYEFLPGVTPSRGFDHVGVPFISGVTPFYSDVCNNPMNLEGYSIFLKNPYDNTYSSTVLEGSNDGTSWVGIVEAKGAYGATSIIPSTVNNYAFLRLKCSPANTNVYNSSGFHAPNNNNTITFGTAPSYQLLIELDCTVPYIPKDINHVFDVTLELQFGEGV